MINGPMDPEALAELFKDDLNLIGLAFREAHGSGTELDTVDQRVTLLLTFAMEQGIAREALARLLGLSERGFEDLHTGSMDVAPFLLQRLIQLFGVSMCWFATGEQKADL